MLTIPLFLSKDYSYTTTYLTWEQIKQIKLTGEIIIPQKEFNYQIKKLGSPELVKKTQKFCNYYASGRTYNGTLPEVDSSSKENLPVIIPSWTEPAECDSNIRSFIKLTGLYVVDLDLKNIPDHMWNKKYTSRSELIRQIYEEIFYQYTENKELSKGWKGLLAVEISPSNTGLRMYYQYNLENLPQNTTTDSKKILDTVYKQIGFYLSDEIFHTNIWRINDRMKVYDTAMNNIHQKLFLHKPKYAKFFDCDTYLDLDLMMILQKYPTMNDVKRHNAKPYMHIAKQVMDIDVDVKIQQLLQRLSNLIPTEYVSGSHQQVYSYIRSCMTQGISLSKCEESLQPFLTYPTRKGTLGDKNEIPRLLKLVYENNMELLDTNIQSQEELWFDVEFNKQGVQTKKINLLKLNEFLNNNELVYYQINGGKSNLYHLKDNYLTKVEHLPTWFYNEFICLYNDELDDKDIEKTIMFIIEKFSHFNLRVIQPEDLLSDDIDTIYFALSTGILKITKDKVESIDLKETEKYLFSSTVRHIAYNPSLDFKQWIFYNVYQKYTGTQDKLDKLEKLIGFMFHRNKMRGLNYIGILVDGFNDGNINAKGGTGKTVISRTIRYLRNTVEIEQLDKSKNFIWSKIKNDTECVILQESSPKGIKIEDLRNIIDKNFDAESKGKDAVEYSGNRCPRFWITTNYLMTNDEDADKRRVKTLPATNYFNKNNPIWNETGGKFMWDGFDEHDWSYYLNYMIFCCQSYLACDFSKVDYSFTEELNRKMINDMKQSKHSDVVEYIEMEMDAYLEQWDSHEEYIFNVPDTIKRERWDINIYMFYKIFDGILMKYSDQLEVKKNQIRVLNNKRMKVVVISKKNFLD